MRDLGSLAKRAACGFTPPFIWNALRWLKSSMVPPEEAHERNQAYYDQLFTETEEYRKHYTASVYYPFWCVLVDRMLRAGVHSVLEIGCGPGQLAAFLGDKGIQDYCGVDISQSAIEIAKANCPRFRFVCQSAFETDLLETFPYDAVLTTEFLEHVENDLEIVRRIRSRARVFGSVPNFPFPSHVRHFSGADDVRARYGSFFAELHIESFPANPAGKTFFLFEGVRAQTGEIAQCTSS